MIAGTLYGFQKGWKFEKSLAFGIATGAANARQNVRGERQQ
ncbi:MAG: hypothetical protein FJ217_05055 [Ignavibacteria bacterium]|nr:hypothetical protein [Ignavibacteria bacterium]